MREVYRARAATLNVGAAIESIERVGRRLPRAASCRVTRIRESAQEARLFWNELRR
jgi:hypothetical protein